MKHIPYFDVNYEKGRFILIEGLNGSGKTTQAELLEKALVTEGIRAKFNHEPTDSLIGRIIRDLIEEKEFNVLEKSLDDFLRRITNDEVAIALAKNFIDQFQKNHTTIRHSEAKKQFLFVMDRLFDLKENILPSLRSGGWVIQDRYDISCYLHGMARGVDFNYLAQLHKKFLGDNYIAPNLIIFYWAPVPVLLKRLEQSGKKLDCYETSESLKEIEKQAQWLFSCRYKTPQPFKPIIDNLKIGGQKVKVALINAEPSIEEVFETTWRIIRKYLFIVVN
ncbi:MAG: dTMP kinase [Minisyncoccia bacterium]